MAVNVRFPLIIPKEVYLQHWHAPYTAAELQHVLAPSDDHERIGTA